MKVFVVTYDLNRPGQNYPKLSAALKDSPYWWHYLTSTWLIATNETADQLWDRISSTVDKSDEVLVIRVCAESQGWLSKEAWDWINKHVTNRC